MFFLDTPLIRSNMLVYIIAIVVRQCWYSII